MIIQNDDEDGVIPVITASSIMIYSHQIMSHLMFYKRVTLAKDDPLSSESNTSCHDDQEDSGTHGDTPRRTS